MLMKYAIASLLLATAISNTELSRRITAAAEELFTVERKCSATWRKAEQAAQPGMDIGDSFDSVLYDDVLSLLDAAIVADSENLHAWAVSAQILLLKSWDGESYDVCLLLDARDDAEHVVAGASRATEEDLAAARDILRQIRRIPPSEIPDPPSSCGENDEHKRDSSKASQAR
jgi:hypothetical protein